MTNDTIETRLLCEARIELAPHAPLALGRSPWRNRRVSDISGGTIHGQRLQGSIRPSGADWSEGGSNGNGDLLTAVDVRSLWETDDGALIYVNYSGRLVIPQPVASRFADPAQVEQVPVSAYYFRILPVFETASPEYGWLNGIVAVGVGQRTAAGVTYRIFEVA